MRDAREYSAQTGEAMRWFLFIWVVLLPWISLAMLGAWLTLITSCGGVAFWLWWVSLPVGLNRRPVTWILTFFLICSSACTLLLATSQLHFSQ